MAEYRLTPAAERDLEAIWIYTLQRWGVEQANRYIDILTAAFAELAQSPKTVSPALTADRERPPHFGMSKYFIDRCGLRIQSVLATL